MKAKKTLPKRRLMLPKQCSTRKRRFGISVLKRFSEARRGAPAQPCTPQALPPALPTIPSRVTAHMSRLAALQLRIAQPPLADQQAFEQNQRIAA